MNFTPEEYAHLVIRNTYTDETHYGLVTAIAKIATKYSKWTKTNLVRQSWTVGQTDANYIAEAQYESEIKTKAYQIALLNLTSRLPKS